jgi:hypothetical protein
MVSAAPFHRAKRLVPTVWDGQNCPKHLHRLLILVYAMWRNKWVYHATEPSSLSTTRSALWLLHCAARSTGDHYWRAGNRGVRTGRWGGRDWRSPSFAGGHDSSRPRAPITPFAPNNNRHSSLWAHLAGPSRWSAPLRRRRLGAVLIRNDVLTAPTVGDTRHRHTWTLE